MMVFIFFFFLLLLVVTSVWGMGEGDKSFVQSVLHSQRCGSQASSTLPNTTNFRQGAASSAFTPYSKSTALAGEPSHLSSNPFPSPPPPPPPPPPSSPHSTNLNDESRRAEGIGYMEESSTSTDPSADASNEDTKILSSSNVENTNVSPNEAVSPKEEPQQQQDLLPPPAPPAAAAAAPNPKLIQPEDTTGTISSQAHEEKLTTFHLKSAAAATKKKFPQPLGTSATFLRKATLTVGIPFVVMSIGVSANARLLDGIMAPPSVFQYIASIKSSSAGLSFQSIFYMMLLALQFGLQPPLTKKFVSPNISRSSVVMVQEGIKFIISSLVLTLGRNWKPALHGWSLSSWIAVACFPAALYSVQNLASLLAYQNLDGVTYNVLNQTKTLSAALCCYFIMGRKQSKLQILSLFILLLSALVIEKVITLPIINMRTPLLQKNNHNDVDETTTVAAATTEATVTTTTTTTTRHFTHGVLPILIASFVSGLAGALTQKNLQADKGCGNRNPYLFTMELSIASILILLASLPIRSDGKKIVKDGFFAHWTPFVLIPISTNALGGIIVGLVTKHAGSVRKGFSLIFGLLLSGMIQAYNQKKKKDDDNDSGDGSTVSAISKEQVMGGILAAISLWMHTTNPHVPQQQQQPVR